MQRDLVLRWLEQIRALVARILRGDPGVQIELAEAEIDAAIGQLLGTGEALFERLEPETVASILGDPTRIYGYAQLLALRSALLGARGVPPEAAAALRARALRLGRAAIQKSDPVPPDWAEWVASIEPDLPRTGE